MSIARHHAEWLSLVPVSGPFLSLPVLMEAFNTGLEPHDPEHVRLLRQEYEVVNREAWSVNRPRNSVHDPRSTHYAFIRFVLTKTLELDDRVLAEGQAIPQTLQVEVPEHHELLRPNFVVLDPNAPRSTPHAPRLLIQTYPRSQELTSYVLNSPWKASPDTRMTELLHGTGVRLGLVTNGEHWMLVDAPKGETTGYASWYASLWLEEYITLRAFRSLLSASRFFNVPDDQTLEALLAKSASNQQEVTDQLGYQVRRAVEVLIHSLDRADQDFGRELLADVSPEQLYESALTVMMRLVFLFCAEERELIPSKPFPVYEQNYSVSTISKQLRELADQHGEELLERRYDAWPRLLAAFRAVYGGLKHDDVHIPAYGGNLFNPDRFPFLEGRKKGTTWTVDRGAGTESDFTRTTDHGPRSTVHGSRPTFQEANPLPVNNRTVLHLLEALQLLQIKVPGGGPAEARRLSFRALDIEQIGHVYEGLLDHTAKRAAEPFLGLAGTRDQEPEIALAELEREAWGETWTVGREPWAVKEPKASFWKYLKEQTGRSESALKKALSSRPTDHDPRFTSQFRTACQNNDALWKRVEPLAGLVRLDSFGYPVVIPKGSVFVTSGTDRRSSGTHYTPRSLTEPIVQYTLEPLVYVGPAEGKPKGEWKLKSAKELLELKICDMACGSGAFLVQAARYMAERLLEAWSVEERGPWTVDRGPKGATDGDSVVSGLGGVEAGDGLGDGMLPGDQDVFEGRTLRNDESDSALSGVDSGKHCRGTGAGTHERVPQSPEHRTGVVDGSSDPSHAVPTSGTADGGTTQPPAQSVRTDQPNDVTASPSPGKEGEPWTVNREPSFRTTLHAPRSTVHAPRSTVFPRTTPHGSRSTGSIGDELIPDDPDERRTFAMRIIAQRCLYGVDKNPLAAEMAKLSLWLLTLAKDKPFEFLDHSIRCGDSLVGLHSIDQLRHYSLKPDADDAVLFQGPLDSAVNEAIHLRLQLEDLPANTTEDVQRQEQLLIEANEKIARLRCAADMLVAAEFWGEGAKDKLERVRHAAVKSGHYVEHGPTEEFERIAREAWTGERGPGGVNRDRSSRSTDHEPRSTLLPFHWPLEFPEVIVKRGGFDAFVGNPPFMGGKRISTFLGDGLRKYLDCVWNFASSNVDLCGYFHLQCSTLLRTSGCYGLISTERILVGDSKTTCIDVIGSHFGMFLSIIESKQWPGDASVTISVLWFQKATSPRLSSGPIVTEVLSALKVNAAKCFVGCAIQGMGFVLEDEDYERLSPLELRSVVRPFLIAKDLNTTVGCNARRKIVFFGGMELHEAERFPNALMMVSERVKPYRDTVNRKAHRERWWQYGDWRPGLYSESDKLESVFVVGLTSKHLSFAQVSSQIVFDQTVVVVTSDDLGLFATLSSAIHQIWALEFGANLGGTPRYNPSRCFEPFPFPVLESLQDIGSRFNSIRTEQMATRQEGLTKIYNRFHNPEETAADIQKLRDLHVEMDQAVAAAYGWPIIVDGKVRHPDPSVHAPRSTDHAPRSTPHAPRSTPHAPLDLGHGFHETKQGVRFTISEPARREVLQRLLKLNHERYAEEVAAGLHEKKGRGTRGEGRGKKKVNKQTGPSLFQNEEDDA